MITINFENLVDSEMDNEILKKRAEKLLNKRKHTFIEKEPFYINENSNIVIGYLEDNIIYVEEIYLGVVSLDGSMDE